MSRLLFLAAIVAVVFWLLKSYRGRPVGGGDRRAEDMVRCAECGVHFPKSEGVLADGKYYCSETHRRASTFAPRQD